MTFAPGDVVRLKSGGPVMTVESLSGEGNSVHCFWFQGSDFTDAGRTLSWRSSETGWFPNVVLDYVKPASTSATPA